MCVPHILFNIFVHDGNGANIQIDKYPTDDTNTHALIQYNNNNNLFGYLSFPQHENESSHNSQMTILLIFYGHRFERIKNANIPRTSIRDNLHIWIRSRTARQKKCQ